MGTYAAKREPSENNEAILLQDKLVKITSSCQIIQTLSVSFSEDGDHRGEKGARRSQRL